MHDVHVTLHLLVDCSTRTLEDLARATVTALQTALSDLKAHADKAEADVRAHCASLGGPVWATTAAEELVRAVRRAETSKSATFRGELDVANIIVDEVIEAAEQARASAAAVRTAGAAATDSAVSSLRNMTRNMAYLHARVRAPAPLHAMRSP